MTVNSLANFGPPGLNGQRSSNLQPILSNRFRILFFDFGNNGEVAPYDMTRQVRSVNRPGIRFDTVPLYSYVSTVYINTRAEWEEITVRVFDDIANSVMVRIQQQISKQMNFFDQTMSRAGENYKFEMDLNMLAGGATAGDSANDPNVLQTWSFAGCQITGFDPGEATYQEATPMELSMTIRFDNCVTFDENGVQMGTFSHAPEINARRGLFSTGAGVGGGFGVNISGNSVSVGFGGNLALGNGSATVSASF